MFGPLAPLSFVRSAVVMRHIELVMSSARALGVNVFLIEVHPSQERMHDDCVYFGRCVFVVVVVEWFSLPTGYTAVLHLLSVVPSSDDSTQTVQFAEFCLFSQRYCPASTFKRDEW